MIRIVTDSNSQIPPGLVERFGIAVVPLTVTVDGVSYLEGVDLDADVFYARLDSATPPAVATAQPSPGQFAVVYDRLVAEGAHEILSVHIGSSVSGTVNAARLAAQGAAVPVRIVDTGTASFAIALCTWAAAEAVAEGATSEEAARAAEATAGSVGNVFAVRALHQAKAGGRLAGDGGDGATRSQAGAARIPVLTMTGGAMNVIGMAEDLDEVADLMAGHIRQGGPNLRVGIGVTDGSVTQVREAVETRIAGAPEVGEVVRYRVGPSVGAHTGPGTVGAMFAPAIR